MIHLYGLIVGIGVMVWWSMVEALDPRAKKIIPWVLLAALVGARLYHVVDYWEYYQANTSGVLRIWEGGLSIWGAIIAGGMVGVVTKTLPALVTPLPLAQAIGRLGNAVNGEFVNKVWILPWWASEAILDLGLFCLIWMVSSRAKSRDPSTPARLAARQVGMTSVVIYLVGYACIRLVLQPYRM